MDSLSNMNIQQYLEQLDELQKKAHYIAKQHLGTSYNISKSNGYIAWMKKQSQKSPS